MQIIVTSKRKTRSSFVPQTQPQILNPTVNPKLQTPPNPAPLSPNPKPSTLHPGPQTLPNPLTALSSLGNTNRPTRNLQELVSNGDQLQHYIDLAQNGHGAKRKQARES